MDKPDDGGWLVRIRSNLRLGGLAVRLTWMASPALIAGIVALSALQAALAPVELFLSKLVIDRAALDLHLGGGQNQLAAHLPLLAWILLVVAVIAVGRLIQPFSSTFMTVVGDRLTGYMTGQLIRAANSWRGLERFEDPGFADDMNRAQTHAARGGLNIIRESTNILLSLLTAAGFAITLIGLHPLAPVVVVFTALPYLFKWWDYNNRTQNHIYILAPEARRMEYSREVMLMPEPAKDLRLYGLGGFFGSQYKHNFDLTLGTLDHIRRKLSVPVSLASALSGLTVAAVYFYTVWRVANGQLTIGDVALFGGAATMLQGRLQNIAFSIGNIPMLFGFLPSLFRVLEASPDLPVPQNPRPAPHPIRQGILFEDVHFTYPGKPEPVLRGVSFTIWPGDSIALVGHNGAGKTTIIKLLLRMYDPTQGRILIDGMDLREYDLEGLRREMGVIFQDFVRYELTAAQNIAMGQIDRLDDRELLLQAASKGGAREVVEGLPEGLDTHLGREFGGRELSGGEWQRLALSRAFIRDCQLLVLDEPTASLDVQTEYDVYSRFQDLTRDRMTLLISHRFSTVRMADRILYLDAGRVREEGPHEELMARNGEYARLYRLQASQYLDDEGEPS